MPIGSRGLAASICVSSSADSDTMHARVLVVIWLYVKLVTNSDILHVRVIDAMPIIVNCFTESEIQHF